MLRKLRLRQKDGFLMKKKKKRVVEYRKRYYEMRKNKNLL